MLFRCATEDELDNIYALYRLAVGKEFCAWDDEYPGKSELHHDFETGNLFVLTDGEKIAGACSIVPENELDGFDFWAGKDGTAKEIARIVVAQNYRGKGLAGKMVYSLIGVLKDRGCNYVRLSASLTNIPALKTYQKAGFTVAGEEDMYGGRYRLLEKHI